jgi:hypothetical protein
VLNAPVPADGIKIILNVDGLNMAVVPLHPERNALSHPQPDTWRFDAGLLPWQGFRFTADVEDERALSKEHEIPGKPHETAFN